MSDLVPEGASAVISWTYVGLGRGMQWRHYGHGYLDWRP